MIRRIALLLAATLLAASAHADVTVGEYKAVAKTGQIPPVVKGYIRGLIEGVTAASAFQQLNQGSGLFCTAKEFHSTFENYAKVIDAYVAIDHPKDDELLSVAVYLALTKYLPCKADQAPTPDATSVPNTSPRRP